MFGHPLLLHLLILATITLATDQNRFPATTKETRVRIADDSELLTAESNANRNKKESKSDHEDRVKTLAQQVADGKYGLIQKELFGKPPQRPGVLSYDDNPEVSNDDADNLGGLDQNEIWLAENHLLVLRGGRYPPPDSKNDNIATLWPPIDNYKAKLHRVGIPARPKVPPPFPVQLTEDGPLQILGTNTSRTINASDAAALYAVSTADGTFYQQDAHGQVGHPDKADVTAGPVAVSIPFNSSRDHGPGMRVPALNTTLPPFLGYLPPGAVVIPPPNNQTDLYDDDDPSIYYPPPYSFFYPKDNGTSAVPPGPLVPGIVLPPPPNFFTLLEETTTTTAPKSRKPQRQRKPTTTQINKQIRPTTTSTPPTTQKPMKIYPIDNSYFNEIKPTKTTPKVVKVLPNGKQLVQRQKERRPVSRKRPDEVTILRPVKQPHGNNRPFERYGPPPSAKQNVAVTTTEVPLRYYTTSNYIEPNAYQQRENHVAKSKTTVRPAQYFYYEETPAKTSTTRAPGKPRQYPTDQYYAPPVRTPTNRPQYIYVDGRPYNTQKPKFRYIQQPIRDTFGAHIAQLQKQINRYITTVRTTRPPSPRPVYQYSFEAADYQRNNFRPSPVELSRPVSLPKYNVEIQQAIEIIPSTEGTRYGRPYEHTTSRPSYATTPRPVSQYSFEATPNPVYQGYYTKPDEGFFDENTKHHFAMFGKKLKATTPIPSVEVTPSIELSYSQLQQQHGAPVYRQEQKPISLQGDTYVNYADPRPTINPDAEFLPVRNNNGQNYPKVFRYTSRPPPSVYVPPQSQQNTEIIKAIPIEVPTSDGEGSFISYQLPGDRGAHFYFLTPQLAERKDQGAGYFYSRPANARLRRNDKSNNDKNR